MSISSADGYNRAVSIEHVQALEERRERLGFDLLQELEQQFQIVISGSAGTTLAWTSRTLEFDVEFINAVNQRYSNLTEPHFYYGVKVAQLVLVTVNVSSYVIDDRDIITGANINIGVVAPGTAFAVAFGGRVDLTFQGFGAPVEYPQPDTDVD
jgi:hypothetical protein